MSRFYGKASYRWLILVSCMLVYCCSQLVRWNYASITKFLMTDLNIGKPELGVLGSAFFYAYALAQIPWGIAVDKFGGRRVIPVGIGILAFFLAGFAFSATYTQAIVWRALMGFVAAAGYVPITSVLSKWFGIKERGLAMEMYSGPGGGLGEALTFLLIPLIAILMTGGSFLGLEGWRGSTVIMGGVILVIAISAALMLKADPSEIGLPSIQQAEDANPDIDYKESIRGIIKDPSLWVMSVVWSCYMVATRLVPGWLPLYATEFYIQREGLSKDAAIMAGGAMATLYVLGRVFGTPFVGKLSDFGLKRGIPRSVIIGGGLVCIGLLFYLYTTNVPNTFMLGLLAFVSGVIINIFPLINASCAELWSVKAAGFSMGIINSVGQLAGALALSVSGYMAVHYSIKGGAFYTEFQGIWYLGIITSAIGAAATLYVIYKEKQALKEKDAVLHEA